MQKRLESSPAGRMVITLFILVTLGGIVVWNLPDSELRQKGIRTYEPYMQALALDQNWAVFAPDPRRQVIDMEARIQYEDGTFATWTFPRGNPVFGEYWDYRWRKWLEYVIADARHELWRPAALLAARESRREKTVPVRVELIRRFYALTPPGVDAPPPRWQSFTYYQLKLTPALRRREGLE